MCENMLVTAITVFVALTGSADTLTQTEPLKSIMGNVVVDTNYGPVRGITWTSQYENLPNRWINAYLGVPYTKTLDQHGSEWREKYRFHNADDDPYWYGTYDATKHKPACPQMPWLVKETVWNFNEVSEDCLYLDIYTPNITTETPSSSPTLYPVLVFFHGGGFIMGTSRQWPGNFLAERFIVVVIVNYRLNALGFFTTGDRYAPGNYGMFDQVKALKFIKNNIRSFRGNPKKITVMGQSSGAASVGMHILSPRSVDLFHQAIMLSGSELSQWAVIERDEAKHYAQMLCKEVGCPWVDSQQMIDCLRYSRSFEQIVNASAQVPMLKGRIGNPWAPVVDGDIVGVSYAFLPEAPSELRRKVRQMRVPLLAGLVRDEGAYFIPNLPNLIDGVRKTQFENIIREFIDHQDIQYPIALFDAMNFQYTYWPQPSNQSGIRIKLIEMMSDYMFGAALSKTIQDHVVYSSVYSYVFEYSSWNNYIPQWRGIAHGQDLDYIFGFPFINETYRELLGIYPRQIYDYSDRNISEFMITMITNFTSSGAPTPRTEELHFYRNVSWWHYNLENHTYLSIKNHSENKANYRIREFNFWNEHYSTVAGFNYFVNQKPVSTDADKASTFELATYSLAAACGVLLFICICLIILLICKSRTKQYPKQKSSSNFDSSPPSYNGSEKSGYAYGVNRAYRNDVSRDYRDNDNRGYAKNETYDYKNDDDHGFTKNDTRENRNDNNRGYSKNETRDYRNDGNPGYSKNEMRDFRNDNNRGYSKNETRSYRNDRSRGNRNEESRGTTTDV